MLTDGPSELPESLQSWPNVGRSFPSSGSSQGWFRYLMCTPNTRTYTFFNMGRMDIAPPYYHSVSSAFIEAKREVTNYLASNPDGPITNGSWSITPQYNSIEIYVQNSKGIMTYGVLETALSGLTAWMLRGYNTRQWPIVFQINDGETGEMGIG